jgi:hypothetical protein
MIITREVEDVIILYGWNVDEYCGRFWRNACEKTTLLIFLKNSKQWKGYSFKVNFRNQIITVSITHFRNYFSVDGKDLTIVVNGRYRIAKQSGCSSTKLIVKNL